MAKNILVNSLELRKKFRRLWISKCKVQVSCTVSRRAVRIFFTGTRQRRNSWPRRNRYHILSFESVACIQGVVKQSVLFSYHCEFKLNRYFTTDRKKNTKRRITSAVTRHSNTRAIFTHFNANTRERPYNHIYTVNVIFFTSSAIIHHTSTILLYYNTSIKKSNFVSPVKTNKCNTLLSNEPRYTKSRLSHIHPSRENSNDSSLLANSRQLGIWSTRHR